MFFTVVATSSCWFFTFSADVVFLYYIHILGLSIAVLSYARCTVSYDMQSLGQVAMQDEHRANISAAYCS